MSIKPNDAVIRTDSARYNDHVWRVVAASENDWVVLQRVGCSYIHQSQVKQVEKVGHYAPSGLFGGLKLVPLGEDPPNPVSLWWFPWAAALIITGVQAAQFYFNHPELFGD